MARPANLLSTLAETESQAERQLRLFRLYNHYRLVLSLLLVALLAFNLNLFQLRSHQPLMFQVTTFAYLGLNILFALMLFSGYRPTQRQIALSILVDLVVLHMLLLAGAGLGTGLANLVIVAVAAGNILIPTRLGFFFAALATLASLAIGSWNYLTLRDEVDGIFQAGLLGIIYFAVAFALQTITRRLLYSENLAQVRAQSIADLEKINHQIIQQMHTGILVCTRRGDIRMANGAASELLLGHRDQALSLQRLPEPLEKRMQQWLTHPARRTAPFQPLAGAPSVQANFKQLEAMAEDLYLIFLEDTSKLMQQAQQMKLASLGRLTAGIAHEIRNPLAAISHAAQLMRENPDMDPADQRMVDIINRHTQRVNSIIENVLQLSRRRSGDVEPHDLNEFARNIADLYHQECGPECHIELNLADSLPAPRFDRTQLEQVLTNLVDNGLRFSERHTGNRSVILRTGLAEDGMRSYIEVQDQGPGVPAENRDTVFEPFFTTDKSGTGLGLYLARELCEANQASLRLLPTEGAGACFRITFTHPERLGAQSIAEKATGQGKTHE